MPDRHNDSVVPFGPRHRNGANGVRPEGMRTRTVAVSGADEPVDMVAVQADDELISALAAGMTLATPARHAPHDSDHQIAMILAAWKAEVDAEPIPELIDLDTAVATIKASSAPASRRIRHLAPVAAAAAFAVLTIGGVSVGSAAAEPDSLFWPVSKVLFSERAASIEAADRAEDHITRAKAALSEGKPEVAAQELQQAQSDLGQVRPQEGQAQLADVSSFLVAKAVETPPGVKVDPEAPLKLDPRRPVPAALTQAPDPSGTVVTPPLTTSPPVVPVSPVTSDPAGGPGPGPTAGPATPAPQSTAATPEPTKEPLPAPATQEGNRDGGPPSTTTTGMGATTTPESPATVPS